MQAPPPQPDPPSRTVRILVVDDNEIMREAVDETLIGAGYATDVFDNPADALAHARRRDPDLVVTDLRMPGMTGIELIRALREHGCQAPVVVVTAFGTIRTAVEAMRQGAYDYITKPFEPETLEAVAARALEHAGLLAENRALKIKLADLDQLDFVVGESPAMRGLFEQVARLAPTPTTVLVRGPSGTGKEVVARALHQLGDRKDKPLFAVNCAALSAGILESELFGHEKGAFTGAESRRLGRFELADQGTILLDEISEIDVGLQAKLLRVLQEREFERVGSASPIRVDVRVIATTNRDLERAVAEGVFREDLYYRLNVVTLEIPTLAERSGDIPELARFFLGRFNTRGGTVTRALSPAALAALQTYGWPGNVRELANVIERASVLSENRTIEPEDLLLGTSATPTARDGGAVFQPRPLTEVERQHIMATLEFFGNNQTRTAEALGISDRTLRNRLKEWKERGLE